MNHTVKPPAGRTVFAGQPSNRPGAGAQPPASSLSAATNRPASRWNANTATGRRCRDLYKSYLKQLGGPDDPATLALILAASENVVLAEMARHECLTGGLTGGAEMLIRLENSANRSLRRIGLAKVAAPAKLSLVEQLRALGHKPPDEVGT
jgi:hypothetical protein